MSWNWRITKIESIEMLEKDENLTVTVDSEGEDSIFYKIRVKEWEEDDAYLIINDDCCHIWHLSGILVYLFDTYGSLYYYDDVYEDLIHLDCSYEDEVEKAGITEDDKSDYFVYVVASRMKDNFTKSGVEQPIIDKLDRRIEESEAGYKKVYSILY